MKDQLLYSAGAYLSLDMESRKKRSTLQKILDFLSFPLRAVTLFEIDRWGLTSLQSERFDYVAGEVKGYCLDIGCGRYNRFIREYLDGNGVGIDVFPYEGLTGENIVQDLTHLPFGDETFESVTLIANIGHIPGPLVHPELVEAHRVLKRGGTVIVQVGNPLAEFFIHRIVRYHDRIFGTRYDVDSLRGMNEEENILITRKEVLSHLKDAGFRDFREKSFLTQWGLNGLIVGYKR